MDLFAPDAPDLIRVLRGDPDDEQLAAVTVVLLSRMSEGPAGAADPFPGACARDGLAHWRRPERVTGFRGPHSWTLPPRWKGQHQH